MIRMTQRVEQLVPYPQRSRKEERNSRTYDGRAQGLPLTGRVGDYAGRRGTLHWCGSIMALRALHYVGRWDQSLRPITIPWDAQASQSAFVIETGGSAAAVAQLAP